MQLPDLAIAVEPLPDDGPVLIQIEYQIAPEKREEFLRAIHAVEPTRRRNGATSWRVFRDWPRTATSSSATSSSRGRSTSGCARG